MKELGAQFYMISVRFVHAQSHLNFVEAFELGLSFQHSDIHDILRELALSSGAELHFDTPVSLVSPGPSSSQGKPYITLSDGQVIHADIIIGADGADSIVRPIVDPISDSEVRSPMTVYDGSVLVTTMKADHDLNSIIQDLKMPHWLGTDSCVLSTYLPSDSASREVLRR